MSILIVQLPQPGANVAPSPEYAYVLSTDGHAVERQGSAAPSLLPMPRRPGEIVALVPAQALSWQRVDLPRGVKSGQATRLRAVLDGMLEERVLDDTQTLHFALAPDARGGESAWVAVCDRAWLRLTLQALEAAGRPVARIVPEFSPDTSTEPQRVLHAIGSTDLGWLVASGEHNGSAVTVLPLGAPAWALLGDEAAQGAELPLLLAEPSVAASTEALAGRPAVLQTPAERWLEAARSPWDLAQFDLANSGRTRAARRAGSWAGALWQAPQWRAARWGIGLLLVSNLIGLNALAWREGRDLKQQEVSVRNVLTQTFPSVQVVVDAPLQMEREIALLRQATGSATGGTLESLLAAAGAALPPDRVPSTVEFSAGEARLSGLQLKPDEVARIAEVVRPRGLNATVQGDALVLRQDQPTSQTAPQGLAGGRTPGPGTAR
jgi:general secretion pathway protein L